MTYLWQTSDGNIVSGANSSMPVVNRPGAYQLIVTDNLNGCTSSATGAVNIDTLAPTIATAPPATLTCTVLQVAVKGSVQQPNTGFSAAWTTTGGHLVSGQNTLDAVADKPGLYFLTVYNASNGCTATAQTTVDQNVALPLAKAAAADPITCAHPQIALDGTGSASGPNIDYTWSGPLLVNGSKTLAPTVGAAGIYILTVTDLVNGCTQTTSVTVVNNTNPPLLVAAAAATLTCVQTTAILNAGASSQGANFPALWTTVDGHFVSGQTTLLAKVDRAGTYVLTIQNLQNGCSSTAQTLVSQNITLPGAEAGPAGELHCNQPEITLQGSSPTVGNLLYAWSTVNGNFTAGNATASPKVDAPGTYTLTVTDAANGCTSTDVATVTEVPLPAFKPSLQQPDCHVPTGTVEFGLVTGGAQPFVYSTDGGQTFRQSSTFAQLKPGAYDLVVSDLYGCTDSKTVAVKTPFFPKVDLENLQVVELGDSMRLLPVLNQAVANIVAWKWSPVEGLSCTDCPSPWAVPANNITYALEITDLNGCTALAKTQLRVSKRRHLYAPNIFSPDDNGRNDRFTIYAKGVAEIRTLKIFDRWGTELFLGEHLRANDESKGWDGSFRGALLNPAVFIWQAVIEFQDGEVATYSGDVTLLR